MKHWDMLNKENSNLAALFKMSQYVIALQFSVLYHVIAQQQMTYHSLKRNDASFFTQNKLASLA